MGLPVVSVLMTAYNREKYIAQAIESVLASTFTDFELIITDDCSKDRTVEIAQSYAAKDNRVKVYINEKNLGDYPNRNEAASKAVGKYLKYVDADDYIYPWGLELLINMMEQFPEAGWGLCSLEQYAKSPFPFVLSPTEAYAYHYQGPGLFHKAPLSSIIKRETFNKAGGFSSIRMAGDFEMWHRLAQKFHVVLMPHGIVWYREHGEQEMKSYFKYSSAYENVKAKYLKNEECPLDAQTRNSILKKYKKAIQKEIIKDILRLRISSLKTNINNMKAYK
jgi:glycosyltransferase involved in cell wall biosynthesis